MHQRTVSLLTGDETYREKHINSLKALIKNVSITRKSVDKIKTDTINLKNNHFNAKNVEDCFENSAFTSAFVKSLNESYNPTKKIVNLLKSIDKKTKDGTEISLEIVRKKGPLLASNHQYFVVSFKNGEKVEEKSVLLSELFKKPLEYRLIQK